MEALIEMVIAGAPNLAVAILVLIWQHRRIEKLQGHILSINKKLLDMPENSKEETD